MSRRSRRIFREVMAVFTILAVMFFAVMLGIVIYAQIQYGWGAKVYWDFPYDFRCIKE